MRRLTLVEQIAAALAEAILEQVRPRKVRRQRPVRVMPMPPAPRPEPESLPAWWPREWISSREGICAKCGTAGPVMEANSETWRISAWWLPKRQQTAPLGGVPVCLGCHDLHWQAWCERDREDELREQVLEHYANEWEQEVFEAKVNGQDEEIPARRSA